MTSDRRRRPVAGSDAQPADPAAESLRFLAMLLGEIPRLRRYATAWLGNAAVADGLVQDAIERVIAEGDASNEPQHLRVQLLRLLHALHEGAAPGPRHGASIGLRSLSRDLPWSGARSEGEWPTEFNGAVGQLSDEHRQTLLLIALEGLSYREAADVLGLPLGTLMSRLAVAREEVLRLTGGGDLEGPSRSDGAAAARSGASELDLHAYLDGELGAERVETVRAFLQSHPEQAERLERFAERDAMIRKRYEPLLHRPLPPELLASLGAVPDRPVGHRQWSGPATAAAAAGLLVVGFLVGWLLRSHFTPAGIAVPWFAG